jgi:hypothetical protein
MFGNYVRSRYFEFFSFVIEIWDEIMSYLICIEKIDLITHEQIMFYVKIQWIIRLIL